MADECISIKYIIEGPRGDTFDAFATGFEEPKSASGGGSVLNANKASGFQKNLPRMASERYACEYNMNHKNRGRAIIFNNEVFDIPELKPRHGTNVDSENLQRALQKLDFEVIEYKDPKLIDILNIIDSVASEDHSDNDCILIAVMSHGENGYLYARDVQYKLDTIWHKLTAVSCPTLAGKPKLFFIQACQGDRLDQGVLLQKTETDGESSTSYKIPIHADFLIAYSTIPGFYSWRNTTNGSWFMQSLVEEFNANGKKFDILTLLTFVNQRVAFDFESWVPDSPIMHRQKQIPCVTSMLTRILHFKDKKTKGG